MISPIGSSRSFTLAEVMLSVTILAIGIIGVLRAYAVSVSSLGVGQENIDAVCLLKDKMTEIERISLEDKGKSPKTSSGEFKDKFKDFEWQLEVKSSIADELNEATLVVSRKGSPRKFTLVTYVENKK